MNKIIETRLLNQPQAKSSPKDKLNKVEGIITSPIKLKEPREDRPYYWAFFQLEGISAEIPVFFRLKDTSECLDCENAKAICRALTRNRRKCAECRKFHHEDCPGAKPEIPFRAKVLLTGTWSESTQSPRPSFTCTEYQILSSPPPLTLKDLKEQISQLLSISLDKKTEWQQRVDYLFRKQKDLQEIDKLTHLGSEYLQAYLLVRKAFYSNYQSNLLPLNQWNQDQYLNKLAQEIEDIACQVRAYQSKE